MPKKHRPFSNYEPTNLGAEPSTPPPALAPEPPKSQQKQGSGVSPEEVQVQFATRITLADQNALAELVQRLHRTRMDLLHEAFALLFEKYEDF